MYEKYASLLKQLSLTIAESIPKQYYYLTERHLQAIWFEQKYFKKLYTPDGLPIHVLSPGIWNAEAGPDFRKAHLKIGDVEFRGDIELHLVDEGWYQHHHDQDERYNDVVLHLSLWNPKKPAIDKRMRTQSGKSFIMGYFEDFFTVTHARLLQLIDLDLYPYKKFIGSGRCAHSLFKHLSEEKIVSLFKDAAEWRLAKKRDYLQTRISDPSWQLLAGIAMALGYKNNSEAFIELFLWLKSFANLSEDERLALGMKECGFFSASFQKKWGSSSKYCYYKHLGDQLSVTNSFPGKIKLVLSQVRPLNHPIRRLVLMNKLLADPEGPTIYLRLIQLWEENWKSLKSNQGTLSRFRKSLLEVLPHYGDTYWNSHYLFELKEREEFIPLSGEDLKEEILVNIFFPLLHELVMVRGDVLEIKAFENLYGSIPAAQTSKTKYLVHRFFGDTPKKAILKKVVTEQGAYQLHKDFCLHFEASCEGCPFVERYNHSPQYSS